MLVTAGCGRVAFDARTDADSRPPDTSAVDAPNCTPIAGLLAHFPLDTAGIIGGVVRDRSGSAADGTIMGTPAPMPVPGRLGEALDFGATTTAYIDVAGLSLPSGAGQSTTISLWFSRGAVGSTGEDLINVPQTPRLSLWRVDDRLCVNTQNGECWGVADATLADRWVHVAVEFTNGREDAAKIFIDGTPRGLGCLTGTCNVIRTTMSPLRLGASDIYAYHGMLDEVRVYGRALDAAEVGALAAATVCSP